MDLFRSDLVDQIAAVAARFVVEDGLEYGAAKRQAGKQLGLSARTPWPDNAAMDAAVREYIAVFCPETQAAELRLLREQALVWMDRLAAFHPHLGGAVWHGTATRHSDVYIQLFCDDPKAAELELLNHRVDYHPGSAPGWRGEPVDTLTLRSRCQALGACRAWGAESEKRLQRGRFLPDSQVHSPAMGQEGGVLEERRSQKWTAEAGLQPATPKSDGLLGQWVLVHLMVHDLDDLRGALKPDALGRKPRGDARALRTLLATET